MVRIEETQKRIIALMKEKGVDSLDLVNDEGLGIVLDSGDTCGVVPEWCNYELKTIYSSLNADTNLGSINLVQEVKDEDDWYTIEDIVKDLLDDGDEKTFEVHYSFYLSDSVEIRAKNEDEAKQICENMIINGEIGNLNEMDVGEQKVWVD